MRSTPWHNKQWFREKNCKPVTIRHRLQISVSDDKIGQINAPLPQKTVSCIVNPIPLQIKHQNHIRDKIL